VLNSKPLIFVNRLVVIPRGYQMSHNSRSVRFGSVLSNQYVDILHNRIQINFYAAHITSKPPLLRSSIMTEAYLHNLLVVLVNALVQFKYTTDIVILVLKHKRRFSTRESFRSTPPEK
jgi:hypothetical protein